MNPALYAQALAGGVPYAATVPVTGDPQLVKVIVYQFDGDRLGSAVVKIR